ncbi:MAG: helix-turn-helix transcriptional regulator [Planctomycetes bacterium]|nr:helix-turn-helix transcriptional regulator [Planctomycetota bacterium]
MSQMDLARAVGTSSSVVSQACLGQRPPPLERMDAWADALGLDDRARAVFVATAQLAHAPEAVRQRVAWLEQRLANQVCGGDEREVRVVTRVGEPSSDDEPLPLLAAVGAAIDACRRPLETASGAESLIDRAWEAQGLLQVLLTRLSETWLPQATHRPTAALLRTARTHLLRAAAAFRTARPSQQAVLESSLRKVDAALSQARTSLEPAPPPRQVPKHRSRG